MDKISELSDELLIKILLLLPTKVAVSTSILSKRWEFVWMWLPKFYYNDSNYSKSECERLQCFLNRNLPLHRAPVMERFHLHLTSYRLFKPEDIKMWVLIPVSRFLRELVITHSSFLEEPNILPSSLYICKTLVILKLEGMILLDVPRMVCLPSLKILLLQSVRYSSEESFERLVSNCHVLEHLLVELGEDNWGITFFIINPCLENLTLSVCDCEGFVIDTPSLKYFKIEDYNFESYLTYFCLVENMPNLIRANVDVHFSDINSLMGSMTFVEHLKLCSKAIYGDGFVFSQLKYLKLCIGREHSSTLLVRLLRDSPNLLSLYLYEKENGEHDLDRFVSWNQPSTVPECLLSSLQMFNWSGYSGRPQERKCVVYILKNARCLKTATISSDACSPEEKLKMIKKLSLSSRASTTCQLVFD